MLACDGCPLFADVAAQEASPRPHPSGHRQRRVSGERANLEDPPRSHGPGDDLHQHGLIVADLHAGGPSGPLPGDILQGDLYLVGPARVSRGVLRHAILDKATSSPTSHAFLLHVVSRVPALLSSGSDWRRGREEGRTSARRTGSLASD